jgi:hypothetical protein
LIDREFDSQPSRCCERQCRRQIPESEDTVGRMIREAVRSSF